MSILKIKFKNLIKGWGKIPAALILIVALLMVTILIAVAAEYVVPPDKQVNGAWFIWFSSDDATGTGLFNPFVRVSANSAEVQGYNTDYRPLQFDESGSWTDSILLSDIPYFLYEDVLYREFQLDINQTNSNPEISLDEVQIWLGEADAKFITGFVPGATITDFGSFPGFTLQEVYNLDAGGDNHITLDASLSAGSGKRDLRLLVPDTFFEPYDEECVYLGTGCEQYMVFYTKFGINYPNNDGFEEWGVAIYNVARGYKWEDLNANGIWDEGELPLEDWLICAQEVDGAMDVDDPICILTGADGSYTIPLPPGDFRIYETCPAGWLQSYPMPTGGVCGSGVHLISVKNEETVANLNFGNYEPVPDIEITKTGDLLSKIGDDVSYTITVDNTSMPGTPDLYCNITDPMLAINTYVTLAWNAPNHVINKTYTVLATDPDPLLNTASVSCTYVGGTTEVASDTDDHSVNLFQPGVEVTKTGDTLSKVGDPVDYLITVVNTSSADSPNLVNGTIVDDVLGNLLDPANTYVTAKTCTATLATGASCTINATRTVLVTDPDPLVNRVDVHYNPSGFTNDITDFDTHSVNLFQPSITFTKTVLETYSKAGDTVHYTITLTNTSSADTPNLACTITDAKLGISQPVTLASGAAPYVLTPSYVVLAADPDPLVNTASVSCSPTGFPNILTASAGASVDLVHPAFTLTKTCMVEPVIAGEYATFQVVFTNTGDVPLVATFDETLTGAGCPATGVPVTVNNGANLTCTVQKLADTSPTPSVVSNTINAHVTLPAMYGLDNYWDPTASDSCDIYGVKSGYKWNDLNHDGIWDAVEPVLSGWKIHFFAWSEDEEYFYPYYDDEVLTGADGKYEFDMAIPGVKYAVCEVLEAGFMQTFPAVTLPAAGFVNCTQFGPGYGPVGYEIMLLSGEIEENNNFGNHKPLGCTYTFGYWKTHSMYGPAGPYDPTWDLKAGGDAKFLSDAWYTGFTWYSILQEPPKGGNAYIILSYQYVAAWLNINNVDPLLASDPSVLGTAMANAEALLGAYTPYDILTPEVRAEFLMLASLLNDYNEGLLGPPHCE